MQKDVPRKKFLETLGFVFPRKPQFSKLLGLLWFWREKQNSKIAKTFLGGYRFVFVECFVTAAPKLKQKISKIIVQFNYCKPPELAG